MNENLRDNLQWIQQCIDSRFDLEWKPTRLHYVAQLWASENLVTVLVQQCGAEIDAQDNYGQTPLYIACCNGCYLTVSRFLLLGAALQERCHDAAQQYWSRIRMQVTVRVLHHWHLVGIVMAMWPLDLPGYVLLWITDWLPHLNKDEFRRITLITSTINSIRKHHAAAALNKK